MDYLQRIILSVEEQEKDIQMDVQGQENVSTYVDEIRVVEAVSPQIDMEREEDGVRISVHDVNGTNTSKVEDGKDYVLTEADKAEIAGIAENSFSELVKGYRDTAVQKAEEAAESQISAAANAAIAVNNASVATQAALDAQTSASNANDSKGAAEAAQSSAENAAGNAAISATSADKAYNDILGVVADFESGMDNTLNSYSTTQEVEIMIQEEVDSLHIPTNVSELNNDTGFITSTDLPTIPTVPTKVSDLQNDAGYLTQHQDISGKANVDDLATIAMSGSYTDLVNKPVNVSTFYNDANYLTAETDPTVPAWAKAQNKPMYTAAEVGALPDDTFIPTKVSDLIDDSGHYVKPAGGIPASDLAETYLTAHQDISGKANASDLAAVATSGSYTDLVNKPVIPEVPVQDVQVNGVSVLQDGVANVPIASKTDYGVVKLGQGIAVQANGLLYTDPAQSASIKSTNNYYAPIVPAHQHESTFYGLAKAAGDTSQSASDNTVGTYTNEAKSAIRTMLGAVGTTDYATTSTYGIVKPGNGVFINSSNVLSIAAATAQQCKTRVGSTGYQPITVFTEDASAFYGLAYASGDTTMASSSNAVGTYTDEAKQAIQTMLGINLSSIASQVEIPLVETVSGTAVTITGQPNTRYMCGEVTSISITPPAAGSIDVVFTSGSTVAVLTLPSTVKMPEWFDASALETDTIYEILITDGVYGSVMTWPV